MTNRLLRGISTGFLHAFMSFMASMLALLLFPFSFLLLPFPSASCPLPSTFYYKFAKSGLN
jgi:hypothetical protein